MVQTDFDNVRLTANPIRQSFETPAAAIPEPGSLMLLIASMGCAIATMRRQ
jgi:hypothetical protein